MQINQWFNTVKQVISEPSRAFIKIRGEENKPWALFLTWILPFALLDAGAAYIGKVVFGPVTINVGSSVVLLSIFMIFLVQILGFVGSGFAVYKVLGWFKITDATLPKSYAIVTYTFIPVYVAIFFGGLIPRMAELIHLFGLYSIYLFWFALSFIVDVPKDKKIMVLPTCLLLISLIYLVTWLVLGVLLKA